MGGGEYLSNHMQDWCRNHGIKKTMGPPHTPQLNGIAERHNCTLLNRLKPSLKNSSLHQRHWSDALSYALWTINRSPTRTNQGHKTPVEVYSGRPPLMQHAHVFGAKGVYLLPAAKCGKLDNHSRDCQFISVLPHGGGVKVIDSMTNNIVKTRDAIFDHESKPVTTPAIPNPNTELFNHKFPWIYTDQDQNHQEPDEVESAADPAENIQHQEIPLKQRPH